MATSGLSMPIKILFTFLFHTDRVNHGRPMAELRRDPTVRQLQERIIRLERELSLFQKKVAADREDSIEAGLLRQYWISDVSLNVAKLEKRLADAEAKNAEYRELVHFLLERQHYEGDDLVRRLSLLEDKIFPTMGPMLDRVEQIIGKFKDWQAFNPLDGRRKPENS
jgi:hypothetical protein